MSDFDNLEDSQKALLQIKLDGYIEAAVRAARIKNIGLLEALSLTAAAFVRELVAYSVERERANELWAVAINRIYRNADERAFRAIN